MNPKGPHTQRPDSGKTTKFASAQREKKGQMDKCPEIDFDKLTKDLDSLNSGLRLMSLHRNVSRKTTDGLKSYMLDGLKRYMLDGLGKKPHSNNKTSNFAHDGLNDGGIIRELTSELASI